MINVFLGSFLNDWWNTIGNFFHDLRNNNTLIYSLIIAVLGICCLLCILRFLKPMYKADKDKFRVAPLVFAIIFGGLICLVTLI